MIDADKMKELSSSGMPAVIATVIKSSGSVPRGPGASMLIFADGATSGTVGGGALEKLVMTEAAIAIQKGVSRSVLFSLSAAKKKNRVNTGMICGGETEVFLDVYKPSVKLVVCGAGHIGLVLAKLAAVLKWDCELLDNRKEYAKKSGVKKAVLLSSYKEAFDKRNCGADTAVVIVTHGHTGDAECLAGALKTKAFYIGMIGSRVKVPATFAKLRRAGLKIDSRVYAPVGVDLGGESPEDIALCIAAEIIKVRNNASGGHMRMAPGRK